MTRYLTLLTCLAAALTNVGLAQSDPETESKKAPVAYVYVSRPTHIDAFAAASDGKLSLIGSPIINGVSHMSVTKKYLLGMDDNGQDIDTFRIGSNGAIEFLTAVNAQSFTPDACTELGPIQIDHTGSTLYNMVGPECQDGVSYQAYKIESNGDLQYLKTTYSGVPADVIFLNPISFLGNNKFAYQTGFASDDGLGGASAVGYQRTSTGILETISLNYPVPNPKNPDDQYLFGTSAPDASDHLVVSLQENHSDGSGSVGPWLLATYTAGSKGNLTTESTYKNMASTSFDDNIVALSISPTGKLVAAGGTGGFQVFHFDEGGPITKLTGKISTKGDVEGFAWDKSGHLYVSSANALYVYNASSTEVKQAAGSSYSIPESSSIIVLDN
jgi:hypothetical protein